MKGDGTIEIGTHDQVVQAETIAAYKHLRIMQRQIHAITSDKNPYLNLAKDIRRCTTKAIDQIEQALEKIKAGTTDSIMLEILNEIDGEIRY